MWSNRKQFLFASLVFLGTVTFLMITVDLRTVGVSSQGKESLRRMKHDHGCYTITDFFQNSPHPPEVLRERGCSKRFPDVLIIGSKKCGTTTLKDFIAFHPQVAAADSEAHYYDNKRFMGIDWFKDQMPYSLPNQIVVEKTPRYFVYPGVQDRIQNDLRSNIKLILVIRDPVIRAVSDFTHIVFKRYTLEKQTKSLDKGGNGVKPTLTPEQAELRKIVKAEEARFNQIYPNYNNIGLTFEESVLTEDGEIDTNSAIIDTGIYVKHIRKWLQYFSPDQLLILDGEELITDPLKIVSQVEGFLGLQPYFTPDHFHFNVQKRFYCLSQPIYACMNQSKGRPHSSVSDSTIEKLKQFYKPYNMQLQQLLNRTFSFT